MIIVSATEGSTRQRNVRQKNGVFIFLSPIFLSPIFLSPIFLSPIFLSPIFLFGGRSDGQGRGFEIVGMSSNWQDGRLWIYLSRFESSHPSFVPVAQLEERTVDGREVVGSTPTGYIEFVGRWCSRSTRSALNREMVGSNPIRPICSIRKIRDSIFFLTGRNDEQRRIGKELAKSFRRRPVERDNRVCRQATISSGIVA